MRASDITESPDRRISPLKLPLTSCVPTATNVCSRHMQSHLREFVVVEYHKRREHRWGQGRPVAVCVFDGEMDILPPTWHTDGFGFVRESGHKHTDMRFSPLRTAPSFLGQTTWD